MDLLTLSYLNIATKILVVSVDIVGKPLQIHSVKIFSQYVFAVANYVDKLKY